MALRGFSSKGLLQLGATRLLTCAATSSRSVVTGSSGAHVHRIFPAGAAVARIKTPFANWPRRQLSAEATKAAVPETQVVVQQVSTP